MWLLYKYTHEGKHFGEETQAHTKESISARAQQRRMRLGHV